MLGCPVADKQGGRGRSSDRPLCYPACAWEPLVGLAWSSRAEDYPRVCGGTLDSIVQQGALGDYPRVCRGTRSTTVGRTAAGGLSPRVWGNRQRTGATEGQQFLGN